MRDSDSLFGSLPLILRRGFTLGIVMNQFRDSRRVLGPKTFPHSDRSRDRSASDGGDRNPGPFLNLRVHCSDAAWRTT
jgi:hypothetical protein